MNTHKRTSIIGSTFTLVFILAACTMKQNENPAAQTSTATVKAATVLATQTATPNPTPTTQPTMEIDYDCSTGTRLPNVDLYFEDGKLARMGNGRAYGIDWSADGSMIAIGGETGLYLIDANTMQKIKYINTDYGIEVVRFSPNGKWIATDNGGTIAIWNIDSGSLFAKLSENIGIHTVRWSIPSNVELGNFSFSPDSKTMVMYAMNYIGSEDSPSVEIWDVETQTKIREWKKTDEDKYVYPNPVFSPFGQWVASPWDSDIRIWNINTGEMVKNYEEYYSFAEFSPDGKRLLTYRNDEIHIVDLKTDDVTIITPNKTEYENVGTFSFDGSKVIVEYADHDGTDLSVWSTKGEYLNSIPVNTYLLSMAVNPTKDELATFGYNQTVSIWDINTGALLREYTLSDYIGYEHFVTLDGSRIIVEKDNQFHFLNAESGEYLCSFEGKIEEFYFASFHPEKPYFAALDTETNQTKVWNLNSGQLVQTIKINEQTQEKIFNKSLLDYEFYKSPYLEEPVVLWKWLSDDETITRWITNSCDAFISAPTGCSGSISADGKLFAALVERKMTLFNANTKQRLVILDNAGLSNNYIFTPDGKYLLILRFIDWSIEVWDTKTYQLVTTISFGNEGEGPILDSQEFNFTADGQYLLLYLPYRTKHAVKMWNTQSWQEVITFDTISKVGDTKMSSDGSLVTAFSGYTLYLWHNELPLSNEEQ